MSLTNITFPTVSVSGTVAATQSGAWSVAVNNGAGAAAVNIQDGGNSITVDGTVAATQSGSWSLAANQSVNLSQVAGTTTAVNNGSATAGTIRVTVADDSTGQIKLATGANTIGALTANQSVNVTQLAGTAISVNAGNVDNGTQRVTLVNNTSIALTANSVLGNSPVRAEDSAFTGGEFIMLDGSVRQDTLTTDTSADGDITPLKSTSTGALWVSALQSGTWNITSITSSVVPGTAATNLGKAEDAAASSGDTGVFVLGVRNDTAATTTSADGDYSQLSVDLAGRTYVTGQVAHDAAFAGNPVTIGGVAKSADITAVAAGDSVQALATLLGKLVTQPYALPASYASVGLDTNTSGDHTVISAPGAGLRLYITSVSISNLSLTTTSIETLKDGAGTVLGYIGLAAPANACMTYPTPLRCGSNQSFVINSQNAVQCNATVTYYTAAE